MKKYILIISYCFAFACIAHSQDREKSIDATDMGSQQINFGHLRKLSQTYPGCYGMLKDQLQGLASMNPEEMSVSLRQLQANPVVQIDPNPTGEELNRLRLVYAIESYNTLQFFLDRKTDAQLASIEGPLKLVGSRADALKLLKQAETVFESHGISQKDLSLFKAHISVDTPSE